MKKKLIDLCRERNKPYGILVRKLDYPSSASIDELRRLAQSGGNQRPVSLPLLVYKVYPDGREELVRSLRFHGVSTRSFKDIVAASDENYVFDFIDSNAPFALMGAGSFTTTASVIAPVGAVRRAGAGAGPGRNAETAHRAAAALTRRLEREQPARVAKRPEPVTAWVCSAAAIFREVANSALFGTVLFTFVLFLQRVGKLFEILVRSSAPPAYRRPSVRAGDSVHADLHRAAGSAGGRADRSEPDVERRRDHRHARRRRSQPQSDRAGADVRHAGACW